MASTYPLSNSASSLTAPARPNSGPRVNRSFWRALFDAIVAIQTRRAENEIAKHFGQSGKLTDSIERAAYQRYLGV